MKNGRLKLFVWKNVLCDYTCGMVCILARDLNKVVDLLLEKYEDDVDIQLFVEEDLGFLYKTEEVNRENLLQAVKKKMPEVYVKPVVVAVYGGG